MERTNIPIKTDSSYSEHAYTILKIGFVLAPLLAGLDKFFNYLTNWTDYLAPIFPELFNISPQGFMYGVGIIEIVAGLGVLFKPKIFAYVISAWMIGIIVNLLILGQYYDVALRDLGLSLGAFALGQLSILHEHQHAVDSGSKRSLFGHHPRMT